MNESNTFWRKEYKDTSNTLEEFAEVMKKYEIKNGEAQIKRDVVLSAWKNYCRESWLYRVLEFIGLR
tara:strand:+ start:307 stop:507 length:201 start_codon:yes stop_codon:yes gene_type:complete